VAGRLNHAAPRPAQRQTWPTGKRDGLDSISANLDWFQTHIPVLWVARFRPPARPGSTVAAVIGAGPNFNHGHLPRAGVRGGSALGQDQPPGTRRSATASFPRPLAKLELTPPQSGQKMAA